MKTAISNSKNTSKTDPPVILSTNRFPVVGIGASAGGLDAFKQLIQVIPEDSGIAYVLVQHLDPKHQSLLPELLQKATKVPVLEITDDMKVMPDHIYIIPSNKMLIANDGVLLLSPRPPASENQRNLPIDLFFTSLAEVHQEHAIGVVLSGTASDGTLGLKAIKDQGGITFAQDERSAAFEGMPRSAVQAGVVDFVLPPEKIPPKLLEIRERINMSDEELENIPRQDEEVFKQILSLLRLRKGTDFTYYKQTTIRRRILRRVALNKNEAPAAYLKFLRENKTEQDTLYQDLLIPVTSFFRDPEVFDKLCSSVFPQILKNKPPQEAIRIWVPACSTGEEAYSIAICLKEFLVGQQQEKIQIFATDLSEPAIAKARTGLYSKSEVAGVSASRLHEFFTKTDGNYQINKELRELCVFAVHNFFKDPPFGKIDFVSCRNALIYMEPYLQKKALTTFHYALNPKGLLLLGKAETTSSVPDLFAYAGKRDKLFTRKDVPGRFMQVTTSRNEQSMRYQNEHPGKETIQTDFQKTADDIILVKYTPPGVVVNEAMDIVHFRGSTAHYLEQAPGKPSHNLLKMAKSGLAFELRSLLHKARKANAPAVKENIAMQINGSQQMISIEAIPLPNVLEPHYLILFHDNSAAPDRKTSKTKRSSKGSKDEKDLIIEFQAKELAQIREDLRAITDDQEAANEELQSANEELLSGSEELQSLNEELETSKEELQSTNEELTVVNQELIGLNEQLTKARNYTASIVSTIREPLLVLDRNLRVKSANPAFYKTFQVSELETEGRLLHELGNKQWNIPELLALLQEVLTQKTMFDNFEVRQNFPSLGERIMLLNGREMTGELAEEKLILLVLEDVTERIHYDRKEKELSSRFQYLVMHAPVAMCILRGADFTVEIANDAYLQLVDRGQEFINKPIFKSLPELKIQGIQEHLDNVTRSRNPFYVNEQEVHLLKNNKKEQRYFNFVYHPMLQRNATVTGIIIVATEVTDQVVARKRMEAQAAMVQDLLTTAPGFVCTLVGPKLVYDLVNDRYQQLFGKRQIKGKSILKALPELKGQGFDKLLDKVYRTGQPYVGIDMALTVASDEDLTPELRYFNFSYQPMYDDEKKIFGILVFGYEVTEQMMAKKKILEIQEEHTRDLEEKVELRTRELLEANASLTRSNHDLKSFAYVSSHDLQEPLRKIQIFALHILEKEKQNLSDTGKEYLHRMQAAADRMQTLINDLLAFSQVTSGENKFGKTDLRVILKEVQEDLKEALQKKQAVIEAGDLCEARVIPFQFRQLLQNLLSNALKFSDPDRPPRITVTCEVGLGSTLDNQQLNPENNYCHLRVADNGIGFQPEYQEKIFEVFQRLHGQSEYPGTGIGLAIVKKIVENHNGVITATGAPGQGATFDIYLPT